MSDTSFEGGAASVLRLGSVPCKPLPAYNCSAVLCVTHDRFSPTPPTQRNLTNTTLSEITSFSRLSCQACVQIQHPTRTCHHRPCSCILDDVLYLLFYTPTLAILSSTRYNGPAKFRCGDPCQNLLATLKLHPDHPAPPNSRFCPPPAHADHWRQCLLIIPLPCSRS